MRSSVTSALGLLMLFSVGPQGEKARELKGGGHSLGESAEQFFSEGAAGELLRSCQAGDWKAVKQLAKTANPGSKPNPKEICAAAAFIKKQASKGERQEYVGGDDRAMRVDTFTLDGGYLVKITMVFSVSVMEVEGFHPKHYSELFEGLREAYGEPTKSSTETVADVYGVKHEARRAEWLGKQDVITIVEQPGENGRTEIVVETLAERERASRGPKTPNPLDQTNP